MLTFLRCFLFSLVLTGVGATTAHAQTVRWEPADSGDPSELQLIFEGCTPDGDPQLPTVEGLAFTRVGTSNQTSIINGSISRSVVLTYRARSRNAGPIQIPAFTVATNRGPIRVPAFTGGAAGRSLDGVAASAITTPAHTYWEGEVFPLTYTLSMPRRYFNQLGSVVEWSPTPLIVEDWTKPEALESVVGGEARLNIVYRTRGYAKTAGRIALNPAQQLVNLQTGSFGFGLFQQPRLEQVMVVSDQPQLTIRPLPANAPATFTGAVGNFTLTSKIVPATASVGEPITWTLSLGGTGNWPDIAGLPAREVSRDFQVVQPQARRTPAEGQLFDATLDEDVVLLPTRPGTYSLGPVHFTYFDPKSGTYKTVTTERVAVTITAPPAQPFSVIPPAADTAAAPTETPERVAEFTARVPAPPAGIPRDPLPGEARAFAPMTGRTLLFATVSPAVVLLALWLGLAVQRARETDVVRSRREARARLGHTIKALRSTTEREARERLLLAWQHDAAIVWQIGHAAPPATALPDDAWKTLWNDADRALYGATMELPGDWPDRAEAALAAKRVPNFSPFQLFLPRNLAPFLVVALAFTAVFSVPFARAGESATAAPPADPALRYRQGDFAGAEKTWRERLASAPTDWIAHHNLALALAQQERWSEAAAHATAAYVQNPRHPSVRWHFELACQKAGYVPPPLAAFVRPALREELARRASPGEWQRALIAASALLALALALLLVRAYGHGAPWLQPVAIGGLCLALVLGAVAGWSLHTYGVTADTRAIVAWRAGTLRSIPTEADTKQQTTPLAAGSVAVVEHTFLDWLQLTFANGQTGWVRKQDVVGLWNREGGAR